MKKRQPCSFRPVGDPCGPSSFCGANVTQTATLTVRRVQAGHRPVWVVQLDGSPVGAVTLAGGVYTCRMSGALHPFGNYGTLREACRAIGRRVRG